MTLIDTYLAELATCPNRRGQVPAPATVRATRADLQGFAQWWAAAKDLAFDPALVRAVDLHDWQRARQATAKNTTLNRAAVSLRSFFAWAQAAGHIAHNVAATLGDLPTEERAPRGVPPEGVDWLFRVAEQGDDPRTRLRDLALLTLLSDCGLRTQEAADVQLRDLDLPGGTVVVRRGKGGAPGRVPLTRQAISHLRAYLADRCPTLPPIGDVAEQARLLWSCKPQAGRQWTPGMTTSAMRYRLAALRDQAVSQIRAQAARERRLERVHALHDLAQRLHHASPHQLRHGLAYRLRAAGHDLGYVRQILRHRRLATTERYGQPTEEDLRAALEQADGLTRRRASAADRP